ncbi:MAG: Uma2 family endonuclease [Phormidium sp. BM_Day4_Bin.17]|nr:Uma2 family endonuclease [Phormidium sp. BM_Day4_Bin.17]UCJ10442.1 MAG: Uma2 family endonuclease [Phormidium sp. PBR-2020]
MGITSTQLSLEQFLKQPETKPASEFIAGEILQKPMPKGRHSRLQGKLCQEINQRTEAAKIAYAFPELRCSFANRSLVPDVAVFLWDEIPFLANGEVPDRFDLPPSWVIEILSPDQRPNKVIGNLLHCLEYGSQLGWFVDPDDASILVFLPDSRPILRQHQDPLPMLEAIPLSLTVAEVFGWLRMAG